MYNLIERVIDFIAFVVFCLVCLTGMALAGIAGLTLFLYLSGIMEAS